MTRSRMYLARNGVMVGHYADHDFTAHARHSWTPRSGFVQPPLWGGAGEGAFLFCRSRFRSTRYHPIEGAFISKMRCSFGDYLQLWHAREEKVRTWHDARLMQ